MTELLKEFTIGPLKVNVYETRAGMGQAAFEHYKRRSQALLLQKARIRSIFAAAHSQADFLAALSSDTDIDFSRIEAFHMDEYIGLGKDAPQNFGNFLKKALFAKRPFGQVNYVRPDAADVEAECSRYENLLRAEPLDIVCLGIGENGHLAFNDPHEARFDEERWVRLTTLDDVCRQQQVNDGEFGHIDEVPASALTLTIPALMSCDTVIGIIPSARKARAVLDTLLGPVSEACPASVLRTHKDATLFLDKDAAELLTNQSEYSL